MNTEEFLSHVLPTTGPYVIAKLLNDVPHKPFKHFLARDITTAAKLSHYLDQHREHVYFAVGALKEDYVVTKEGKKKISRAAANIRGLRAQILDIDVRPDGSGQYPSLRAAIEALVEFVKAAKLPYPTLVSSGSGLHVYWTLTEEITAEEFHTNGEALKALAALHGLAIDQGRTADAASVLRVAGTHNAKYNPAPLIEVLRAGIPTPPERMQALLQLRNPAGGVLAAHGPVPVSIAEVFGSNIKKSYDSVVLDFRKLLDNCRAFRAVADPVNQRSGTLPEPAWNGALGLAIFCKNGDKAAHLISNQDPRYNKAYVDAKIAQLRNFGPTTCARMQEGFKNHPNADCCNGCPSKGLIGSPAAIAKYVELAAPVTTSQVVNGSVVEKIVPPPPHPFVRTSTGIGIITANSKTGSNETLIFCDYDLYPIRMRVDERTGLEDDVRWRVKLPRQEWIEVDLPHVAKNQLSTTLSKRGMYIQEYHLPYFHNFMTAYVRKLQNDVPREVAFAKLGFRKGGEFVLGDTLYKSDGTSETHTMSRALDHTLNGSIRTGGDYDTWRQHISIYARPGNEPHRAHLYSAFASILYHMTGHIATCVSAVGVSGLGKSTLMDACASIWGDPQKLVVKGSGDGSTRAAAEVLADAMHHLPIMMDEITGREAKDVASLVFNYSGGKGKIRSTAAGGIRNDTATWSNLLLLNANTDEYERISTVMRESLQHLVRLVQIEFTETHVISKGEGDILHRAMWENYGWAGHIFVAYAAQHYTQIKKRVLELMDHVDKAVGVKSEERFWASWVACAWAAGEIATNLGILPGFPITSDVQWMLSQLEHIRKRVHAQLPASGEIISEFLDSQIGATLRISAKGASNIDNVISEPGRELAVRIDLDANTCYINRAVFRKYCVEGGINFNRALHEMVRKKVLVRDNVLRVLGAGTVYATGKVRCLELDMDALGDRTKLTSVQPAVVTPIAAAGGTRP